MQPIQAIRAVPLTPVSIWPSAGASTETSGGPSFKDLLANSLERLSASSGQSANVANVLAAAERADTAVQQATQIGQKLVAAYDEIKDLRI